MRPSGGPPARREAREHMIWRPWVSQKEREQYDDALRTVQGRFSSFLRLLDANNRVLKLLGSLEEKVHGEAFYDLSYIRSSVSEIRALVREIIDVMVLLGGEDYAPLRERLSIISAEVEAALMGSRPVTPGEYILPFESIGRDQASQVGSKNAQLGEMMSRLGLPVPDGFAISAWAYKVFVSANDLQKRIDEELARVDTHRYEDLVRASEAIQSMIVSSEVPADLAEAIRAQVAEAERRSGARRFALRSSALGEDDLLTFAGQYRSILNVRAEEVVEAYRSVLAGKFTPKAIFYLLSHDFRESDLAMCVGCISMIEAVSSGVVYTRDPVHPSDGCLVVNSVFGLGQLLVDGTLTPDVFRVRRDRFRVVESRVAPKPERLIMSLDRGTTREPVPPELRNTSSLGECQVRELARMALEVERHYGAPQDVEWALDGDGRLFLLQTRPLQLLAPAEAGREPRVAGLEVLLSGGATVCPGAGCGPVHHASSSDDLPSVPDECVLMAPHPFPGLVSVLAKISALITEVGGLASHTATLAREYRVPTIMGIPGLSRMPEGRLVTVDATAARVYAGEHPSIVRARWIDRVEPQGDPLQRVLRRVLACMSPLNLLYLSDPGFTIESCQTLHDITRFCHQKSMQELFERTANLQEQRRVGLRLRTDIPLQMNIVCLDREPERIRGRRWVDEDDLLSLPMMAFWAGIKEEGWPTAPSSFRGLASVSGPEERAGTRRGFSEDSYAVLSREYMVTSLRMGYHFTTVEALCSEEPSKNFVSMQYKHGGAVLERRKRRLRLLTTILSKLGFENLSEGDFLDSRITYLDREPVLERLRILGRLMIMTKQLDMALSSDSIADWYTRDFIRKLGIAVEAETKA